MHNLLNNVYEMKPKRNSCVCPWESIARWNEKLIEKQSSKMGMQSFMDQKHITEWTTVTF
jgi:hypothetical protein